MAHTAESFGRVDADGTVRVHDNGTWRAVGSFPDGTPEEALAYFEKKYSDLEALVSLVEQRLKSSAQVKDIRKQVTSLTKDLEEPAAVGDLASLRSRLSAVEGQLGPLEEKQKEEQSLAIEQARAHRLSLVEKMEALAALDPSSIRWKDATSHIAELFEAWQAHQQNGTRLPKKEADELWARFRKARNSLEKARRAHFQSLDEKTKESKGIKRDLIAQAEALAEKGAAGIPAYRALLEKWKAAPRAARAVEDGLWQKFKAAGDVLYKAKTLHDAEEDEKNQGNLEAKKALLAEYANILTETDRKAASARLREFNQKFQAIGPVPKKNLRAIDDEVKRFEQHVRVLEEDHWKKNDPDKKARSDSMSSQLKSAIEKLEAHVANAEAKDREALMAELETKRAWLKVIEG